MATAKATDRPVKKSTPKVLDKTLDDNEKMIQADSKTASEDTPIAKQMAALKNAIFNLKQSMSILRDNLHPVLDPSESKGIDNTISRQLNSPLFNQIVDATEEINELEKQVDDLIDRLQV